VTANKLLLFTFCLGWLLCRSAIAQAIDSQQPTLTYNHRTQTLSQNNDVAVAGTVQRIDSQPTGIHILVKTEQGMADANLGPYVPNDVRETLATGQQVRVVGISKVSNEQNHLLVRQMEISGRQVTIRNEHGFLVRAQSENAPRLHKGESQLNGGN